jgi:hypothetical protein
MIDSFDHMKPSNIVKSPTEMMTKTKEVSIAMKDFVRRNRQNCDTNKLGKSVG